MRRFERGAAAVSCELADDGIVSASVSGLLLPSNAGAVSALLLDSTADLGALGVLCTVRTAMVALPPIEAQHYRNVAPGLRDVPVAVLVLPQQLSVYANIAQEAARVGAMRRAFLSREQALEWLQEQALALAANRLWWTGNRATP